jgi:hypothetical protein
MIGCSRPATLAVLSILWCGVSASAETLRCQSVNGNLNCAGSNGVSCQTVNGKTVCISGHGGVRQSFGNASPSDSSSHGGNDEDLDNAPLGPAMKERLEQRGADGHMLLLEREGVKLHLRTDWLSIDRD